MCNKQKTAGGFNAYLKQHKGDKDKRKEFAAVHLSNIDSNVSEDWYQAL